jgi:nitrite reductase (NO-forming)
MVIFAPRKYVKPLNNKKMKKITLVFGIGMIGIAMAMTSCGGGSEQKAPKQETAVQKETPAAGNDQAKMMARGEEIYKAKCFACHQANGQGIANVFPNLVGSQFLLTQTKLAVSQVLNGSANVVANRTVKYPAPMPPQCDTKEDAVAVVNYVLTNFGNSGKLITLDDVKDVQILPRP